MDAPLCIWRIYATFCSTKKPEDSGKVDAKNGMTTFIHYGRPDSVLNVYGLPGIEYPGS
jgi:hypothetical protein